VDAHAFIIDAIKRKRAQVDAEQPATRTTRSSARVGAKKSGQGSEYITGRKSLRDRVTDSSSECLVEQLVKVGSHLRPPDFFFFSRVGSPGGVSADEIYMETTTTTTTMCIYAPSYCPTTGQLIHFQVQEISVPPNKASKSGDASKRLKWVLFYDENLIVSQAAVSFLS
jgi:hypothetical protein